jgi:putative transposase
MSVAVVTVAGVTRVVKVRVLPTEAEAIALEATLRTSNNAATWLAARMHAERRHRRHDAQKRFYSELRRQFGLAAQPTIRVIGKVEDAETALRANTSAGNCGPPGSPCRTRVQDTPIRFRSDAAQPFDARCLSWQIPDSAGTREASVSIWSVHGRLRNVRVTAAQRDLVLVPNSQIRRDGPDPSGCQVVSICERRGT